jgi:Tfp pilus assembly protein PilW
VQRRLSREDFDIFDPMHRQTTCAAFSLIEVLVATAITVGMGAVIFQLLHQNERIFRDQALIIEMQQTARMVASAIADDIRMAGQAIPPDIHDVLLPGSSTSRLNIRAGFSATETTVTAALPLSATIGTPLSITVEATSGFSTGRQAFLWSKGAWVRAAINSVSGTSRTLNLTPLAGSAQTVQFVSPPAISLDEAVAIYRDASTNAVRRTTATNTENPSSPPWAPANELAANVSELTFLYYDSHGMPLGPESTAFSSEVTSIECRITARTSAPLSNGSQPTFSLSIRSLSRNLSLR